MQSGVERGTTMHNGRHETKSRKETMYTCASDLGPRGCYIMVDYISHHLLFTGDNNSIDTIDKIG